jgi:hypothetical protein
MEIRWYILITITGYCIVETFWGGDVAYHTTNPGTIRIPSSDESNYVNVSVVWYTSIDSTVALLMVIASLMTRVLVFRVGEEQNVNCQYALESFPKIRCKCLLKKWNLCCSIYT